MAIKLNVETAPTKGDVFYLNPREIKFDPKWNGRYFPVSDAKIRERVESMITHGQRTPVEIRRLPDKTPMLVAGFTRLKAALIIVEERDPEWKIQAVLSDCNESTAYIRNIVENAHRAETSIVDDAFNAQRLKEVYGKSDAEICEILQRSRPHLNTLRSVVLLPPYLLQLLHEGSLTTEAALILLRAPEDTRQAILAELITPDGAVKQTRISRKAVAEKIREKYQAALDEAEAAEALAGDAEAERENQDEEDRQERQAEEGEQAYDERNESAPQDGEGGVEGTPVNHQGDNHAGEDPEPQETHAGESDFFGSPVKPPGKPAAKTSAASAAEIAATAPVKNGKKVGPPAPKAPSRSDGEQKRFWEARTGENTPFAIRNLAVLMGDFRKGNLSDSAMDKQLMQLFSKSDKTEKTNGKHKKETVDVEDV